MPPRSKQALRDAAARARNSRHPRPVIPSPNQSMPVTPRVQSPITIDSDTDVDMPASVTGAELDAQGTDPEGISADSDADVDVCGWDGSTGHCIPRDADGAPETDITGGETDDDDDDDDDEIGELEGPALRESLEKSIQFVIENIHVNENSPVMGSNDEDDASAPSVFARMMAPKASGEWKKAESNRNLGYTGLAPRTQRRKGQAAREGEAERKKTKTSSTAQFMKAYFAPKEPDPVIPVAGTPVIATTSDPHHNASVEDSQDEIFTGYLSDISLNPSDGNLTDDEDDTLKRQRLTVPYREARQLAKHTKKDNREKALKSALKDMEKIFESRQTEFEAGRNGLQFYRAQSIRAHLEMMIKGRGSVDASSRAAEALGFSSKWGGRLVRSWTAAWIDKRDLPKSQRGQHRKAYSLLTEDPAIRTEMRSYLRSNKWAMDPAKLQDFTEKKMIPAAAKAYLQTIVDGEMPRGLKKYLELELFPRIQLKVAKGIKHKKALYYDGHERPDVVKYRQEVFIPAMDEYRKRMVEYMPSDVMKEVEKDYGGQRKLVLVAHDEMTAQANDGEAKSWVLEGEHALKKKGVGRGIHQSDVICSTFGHLPEASRTLEYGKNYEGYWDGDLFIKQLEQKIIPVFEKYHDPKEYQALTTVDNSQGHSAYSKDALLVTRMNWRPAGKQAVMRDGWFMKDGVKVIHPMNDAGNVPKGMQKVLEERGLLTPNLKFQCGSALTKCDADAVACCGRRIMELQPDFIQQRSLVQEVIEARGHLCIFLPKFHCELNFIEFFWGAVKKYLRKNCDYTFPTLKANMPEALKSVELVTIRKWEFRMARWIDAYRSGMDAKSAQIQVKAFSSRKYTSHRRIPEHVARSFD
ncbi:hypothetical protein C8J56DRAFT_1072391 [Mycena floridula]|nr:hypothetical protein C8J56DRAFT_1072391 [Mycena floridula]